jgi:histidinol-phosphate aminotransferase
MWIKKEIKDLIRVRDMSEKRQGMLRMDRNERTLVFQDDILQKIKNNITSETLTNYPEIETLYGKMARYLGVGTENLIFHTGSDLVIKSIYETYISRSDKVLLQKPAYAMYSVYAEMFQAKLLTQQYGENWKFDLEEYQERIVSESPKMVVLENPNGSIGNCYTHQQVETIIKTAAEKNALAVIDEAYIDFCGGSVIDLINKYNNLIVVRTMSKAWGMAGLRVGYAVSCKDNINELFQVKPMHQLTSFSVMAAETLLDNTAAVRSYIEEMNRVRQYVTDEFECRGIATTDSAIHFVTAELGKAMDVDSFRKFLKERKYLIRRPFGMPELSRWVRIGLLPMKQMKGFIELLDRFLEENRI